MSVISEDGNWEWNGSEWIPYGGAVSDEMGHLSDAIHISKVDKDKFFKQNFSMRIIDQINSVDYAISVKSALGTSYTVKLEPSGEKIGKIKKAGLFIWSGYKGVIELPNGKKYSIKIKTGLLGAKGVIVSDVDGGRGIDLSF